MHGISTKPSPSKCSCFQDKRMTGMLKIINNRSILQGRSASESTAWLNADHSGLVHIRARERQTCQRASFTPTRAQTGVGWWPDEDKKGHLSLIKRATSYEGLQGQRASVLFMSSPYCPAFIALNHINSYLSQATHLQYRILQIFTYSDKYFGNSPSSNCKQSFQSIILIQFESLHYFYESLELYFD